MVPLEVGPSEEKGARSQGSEHIEPLKHHWQLATINDIGPRLRRDRTAGIYNE